MMGDAWGGGRLHDKQCPEIASLPVMYTRTPAAERAVGCRGKQRDVLFVVVKECVV